MMKKKSLAFPIAFLVALAASGTVRAEDAKAGDPVAGAKKVDMCMGCHGLPRYQASFPEIYKVPKIGGQNEKYLVAALTEYRKGERKHPTMRAVSASLSDQDIADAAAFFAHDVHPEEPVPAKPEQAPPADVAKLLAQANCASCHGENLSKPIDPSYPKLAGQYADYLYAALKAYQTQHNPRIGRSNAIMMGMARPFTHAELKALAGYIASLPGELQTVTESRFR